MMTRNEIEERREAVLNEMRAIRTMKKATLSMRPEKVKHKGCAAPVLRGPYGLLVWREGKKSKGKRLRSEQEIARAREQVEGYKRFKTLCGEFAQLSEQLGELEREATASDEAVKKGLKSRSRRAGKSHASSRPPSGPRE